MMVRVLSMMISVSTDDSSASRLSQPSSSSTRSSFSKRPTLLLTVPRPLKTRGRGASLFLMGLPENFLPVEVIKSTTVFLAERRDYLTHARHAALRWCGSIESAHICLDPAGMQDYRGDAARSQVEREAFDYHVECCLAGAIQVITTARIVVYATHFAGDIHDLFLAAFCHMVDKSL